MGSTNTKSLRHLRRKRVLSIRRWRKNAFGKSFFANYAQLGNAIAHDLAVQTRMHSAWTLTALVHMSSNARHCILLRVNSHNVDSQHTGRGPCTAKARSRYRVARGSRRGELRRDPRDPRSGSRRARFGFGSASTCGISRNQVL
jgi:hypothetical protein